ncbi:hypothetical protein U1Q18_012701, partial [Sarracenia purpurea var. burkii]
TIVLHAHSLPATSLLHYCSRSFFLFFPFLSHSPLSFSIFNFKYLPKPKQAQKMESLKMKAFLAVLIASMAVSAVQNAVAAEAPAPSPVADASFFVPSAFASIAAIAFGLLF